MLRGISLGKVEEAIRAAENEREIRRKMFADNPDKQHTKVREMNIVMDILRWGRQFLLIPGERLHDDGRSVHRRQPYAGSRDLDGRRW